jgi:hypothetical protein
MGFSPDAMVKSKRHAAKGAKPPELKKKSAFQ